MHLQNSNLQLVLITGMSGSGKSVALHALEDAGYYCVDNLPPQLLLDFVALQAGAPAARVAIAMDVRSAKAFPQVPAQLERLRAQGMAIKTLFLDASTETLVRRYSETRRRHPLSQADAVPGDAQHALVEAIELERRMLETMRAQSYVIDSSMIRASQLQSFVKSLITAPVATYLRGQPAVAQMQAHIAGFLETWLDALVLDHRSYVTVAIGCTGGQHRSVYLVEQLAAHFAPQWVTLRRHRELDSLPPPVPTPAA